MTGRWHEQDEIQSAHFAPAPSFASRMGPKKGRKADGVRYEKKVHAYLCEKSSLYLPSPWIIYIIAGRPYWCQPDGLHFDVAKGVITIVEVKYSHTSEARRQLRGVYEPVIRTIFPRPLWGVRLVEVTKWFDPDVRFGEPTVMCADPFEHKSQSIGVHVWRP